MRPETPRIVWTLHARLLTPGKGARAVRRRVVAAGDLIAFAVARDARAFVPARDLALHGRARTCRGPAPRAFHLLLDVYDHPPSPAERRAFQARHAAEQRALAALPTEAWLILPGDRGLPDRAHRCPLRPAPEGRRGPGTRRFDMHLRLPFPGDRDLPRIDALDLAVTGLARFTQGRSTFLVCAAAPARERLAELAAERRDRPEDTWFREDAEALLGAAPTAGIVTGEAAIGAFGLTLPCAVEEVGRAFRRRVVAERAHPDQGGSDEELRELVRVRDLALAHLERRALPARSAA